MKTFTVIKYLDIFKYILLSLVSGFDSSDNEPVLFSRHEKNFLKRHYPNICLYPHTLNNAMFFRQGTIVVGPRQAYAREWLGRRFFVGTNLA